MGSRAEVAEQRLACWAQGQWYIEGRSSQNLPNFLTEIQYYNDTKFQPEYIGLLQV